MDYSEALKFIHGIARFGTKLGLSRVQLLLERLGNPQKKLKFIHVAGTNGKGSTCTMISRVLSQAGYKTGLYISPFVLDFCERIQIDGEMIDREDFARVASKVKTYWDILDLEGDTPSEFETLLACAFEYFLDNNVDIVLLEVGMGGRLDATNVIDPPLAAAITSLGMDHMEYLGDTIEKIATEKCGIIKPGSILVCYPEQKPGAWEVIRRRCSEENVPLFIPEQAEVLSMGFFGSEMKYKGLKLALPLIGAHQIINATVALELLLRLDGLGFKVNEQDIVRGMSKVSFPARLEIISRRPLVILDGAHNVDGARVLGQALDMLGGRKIHAVVGMQAAKDVAGTLELILPHLASLTAVSAQGVPGALPPGELVGLIPSQSCTDLDTADSPREGVEKATARLMGGEDVLLVCGSLYLASEVRPILFEIFG